MQTIANTTDSKPMWNKVSWKWSWIPEAKGWPCAESPVRIGLAAKAFEPVPGIRVLLCQNSEMLLRAQRLRYAVYCEELGRNSPYADHTRKILTDSLDEAGHTFIAVENEETIGTLRVNVCREGSVGALEELYGMRESRHHPHATTVVTKFIVKKSKRGGPTSIRLISAAARYGLCKRAKECYIDCIPQLLPYYRAIGFVGCADPFLHPENGLSYPMVLDEEHIKKLSNEHSVCRFLSIIVKAKFFQLIESGCGTRKGKHAGTGGR